jgi:enterochelin esterase-like enzyme
MFRLTCRILSLLGAVLIAAPTLAHGQTQGIVPAPSGNLAGLVFDAVLYSPILAREMPYRIYLPPEYLRSDVRRFPVLYMLHGAGGNYTEWSDSFLPQQLDALIQNGSLQPMIVVMPDGGGRTYFANWDNDGPRYSDYLAQDVISEIDVRYRTLPYASSRAVGGLSMGGLAALQVAMRNPYVFGIVGAHSPSIRLEPDQELWFLTNDNWLQHDPIWLAANSPGTAGQIYWIDVGAEDWWRPNIEYLDTALISHGLRVTFTVFSGTHEADYWIEHVPDYVRFYSTSLRYE